MSAVIDVKEGVFRETNHSWVLLGDRERSTGTVRFPTVPGDDGWEQVELSTEGALFTWSTVRMPSANFDPPYTVGYVRLPEGVLVFAPLQLTEGAPPRIGQRARLEVGPSWTDRESGNPVRAYRFALVEEVV